MLKLRTQFKINKKSQRHLQYKSFLERNGVPAIFFVLLYQLKNNAQLWAEIDAHIYALYLFPVDISIKTSSIIHDFQIISCRQKLLHAGN